MVCRCLDTCEKCVLKTSSSETSRLAVATGPAHSGQLRRKAIQTVFLSARVSLLTLRSNLPAINIEKNKARTYWSRKLAGANLSA